MDTLAPATLAFRRRATLERVVLDAGLEIGAGGEAVVYEVPGDPAVVAKVYHEPTSERARKLTQMLAHPPRMPAGTSIAWPTDLLLNETGFAGFVMPRAEGPRVFEFYNPTSRRSTAPAFHYGLLHRAGRNLAAAFHALHAAGYVVGDVNESNILVNPATAAVTLVDADSFQVVDPDTGAIFRSHVGKAEFTPPELQGIPFGQVDRGPEHDRFGLAVLLYLLLMEGMHPFAVRIGPGAQALAVEERTRRGLFPHTSDEDDVHPPRLSPPVDTLDPGLRALFVRCFADGHPDPSARPSPAEWMEALKAAEAALVTCAKNRLHRHHPHLDACPWCERAALLRGRDPFPVGARAKRVKAPPRARRTPRAKPPHAAPVPSGPATAPPPRKVKPPPRARPPRPARPSHAAPAPSPPATAPAPWQQALAPPSYGPLIANPLVFMLAGLAAALAGGGGTVTAVGVIVVCGAAGLLLRARQRFHSMTVVLALVVAVLVGAVVRGAAPGNTAPPLPGEARTAQLPAMAVGEARGVTAVLLNKTVVLRNKVEVDAALETAYTDELRRNGLGGIVLLRVPLDETGKVEASGVEVMSARFTELGVAAASVAERMQFEPAQPGGELAGTSVYVTVDFVHW